MSPKDQRRLGLIARRLRDAAGLTQKDAARRLGITNVHLCNIERGVSLPSFSLLDRYGRVFGGNPYVIASLSAPRRKAKP